MFWVRVGEGLVSQLEISENSAGRAGSAVWTRLASTQDTNSRRLPFKIGITLGRTVAERGDPLQGNFPWSSAISQGIYPRNCREAVAGWRDSPPS